MCILFVYTLLKVISYCGLSVLSVSLSVMCFQKIKVGVGLALSSFISELGPPRI